MKTCVLSTWLSGPSFDRIRLIPEQTFDIVKEKTKEEQYMQTREESIRKIEYYIPNLTDRELALVTAFISGLKK